MADDSRPLLDRLRVVSAIGAASAMFTLGGRFPTDAETAEVRAALVGIVRAVLAADPAPSGPRPDPVRAV